MAPDEQSNEEKPEEVKEESINDSEKEVDSEKMVEKKEDSELEEDYETEDELDTKKELDRLRFHYRGFTLDELKKMNMDTR